MTVARFLELCNLQVIIQKLQSYQQTLACSKATLKASEKGKKCVQS